MDGAEDPGRGGIQVIARAAAVLRALKDQPGGLSLAQIAAAVGLPRSTVQRIVQALAEERLLIAAGTSGVRLGPELLALAGAAQDSAVDRCRPVLQRLADTTGETVDLSILRGGRMIFLDQVPGRHRLRAASAVGEVFPLATTANGRACLARLPEAEARRLVQAEGADWAAVQPRLAAIGAGALAEDAEDHTPGIAALGFAFADLGGSLHAISVPVPAARWGAVRATVAAALAAARADIARIYG